MKLDTLEIGKDAVVASVASDDQALRQHILDMGLTPGTEVTMMKYAPMGDPLEIRLRGYELTPVSYTHLDVYKRQTQDSPGPDRRRTKSGRLPQSVPCESTPKGIVLRYRLWQGFS